MFFNGALKRKVAEAKGRLEEKLQNLRKRLSRGDLDGKLRTELEEKECRLRQHLDSGIHELNGGAQ